MYSECVCVYVYVSMYMCVYIYIYIYMHIYECLISMINRAAVHTEEHSILLESEAVSLGEWFSTLRSIVVTSSSTTKQSAT